MDDSLMRAAQGTPWSTWVLLVGLLGYAASQLPAITKSSGNAITSWFESKRRTAELRDDADITDLKRQVGNLTEELSRLRAEMGCLRAEIRRRDRVLHDHYRWDVKAYQLIVSRLGEAVIEPPPDLWPLEPDASLNRQPATDT